ncbi:MAG: aminopeptidase P family protein [Alphaproteobacteria bacterium]|nr:aminopeptidase P family protein [Alphaproteobacteria bacterium]NCQ87535.1 aminopeptidase P family protein [Alphaproteobacteria bacterium]NCT06403.1 aminopeptidase P family protein [Alphaproteobacteria bacterium]
MSKIDALRKIMVTEGVNGFLVPRTDEYQGEYVPACAERLRWLTGFTGSAGMAIILDKKAVVMSDGRYTIQLDQQVDKALFETENSQIVKPEEWIKENTKDRDVIGYDAKLHTRDQIETLIKAGIKLQALDDNLIDAIWTDRPEPPCSAITLFPGDRAGRSAQDKIDLIVKDMTERDVDALILTLSDSIAWLLNIRANDIPHIPVALSYAIIFADGSVQWFIDKARLGDNVRGHLPQSVHIMPPKMLEVVLKKFAGLHIWLDPKRSSVWFDKKLCFAQAKILYAKDPCIDIRARKTTAEQNAMKTAHVRDGVAMVKFLKWFEREGHNETLNEISVEEKLTFFRAQAPEFRDTSFDTIAGYASHGAIVHYRATKDTALDIKQGNILLLDSGGQYEDGTTDITRTLSVGEAAQEIKEHNTLVLKAHIMLATAVFKKDTLGKEIDAICRKPLKDAGLDYAHGTGHGVGCYLSVHEEAGMGISPRSEEPLAAGMILSNEPGYYVEGSHGIRIENLVLVQENDQGDLYFETITLAPFDKNLILPDMLSVEEIKWVNDYHARVYDTLSPLLDDDHQAWLKAACSKITQ